MTLEYAVNIAIACGLTTIGEAIYDIKRHMPQLCDWDKIGVESNELHEQYDKLVVENNWVNSNTTFDELFKNGLLDMSKIDIDWTYKEIEDKVETELFDITESYYSEGNFENMLKDVRDYLDNHYLVKSYYYRFDDDYVTIRISNCMEQYYYLNIAWVDISNRKNNIHITSIRFSRLSEVGQNCIEGFMEEDNNE